MARAELDSRGRPIVVVTGTGVLTSLGTGKQDNWRALTAGRSGIHRISRFPVAGLRTTIAGTVDFVGVHFLAQKFFQLLQESVALVTVLGALQRVGADIGQIEIAHEQLAGEGAFTRGFAGGFGQFKGGPLAARHF